MYAYKKLIKFIFRRERTITSLWLFLLIFITVAIAAALCGIYGAESVSDLPQMAKTMKNPAMIAMVGPVYGADNYTLGALNSNMMLLFTVITVAIMNIFFIIRHTRRDEERGRIEVIRSLPVGRLTNLGAAMTAAVIVNLVLGVFTGIGLSLVGEESMGFGGSMLYGMALSVCGIYFAAVTALFAQLFSSSRAASGAAGAFLGLCYIIRAAGDIGNEALACIFPPGLILRAQVYVENHWWPVFIVLVQAAVISVIAFYLNSIRDMDQSFIPAKPGRKSASFLLGTPFGLVLRLTRSVIISWVIGMFIFGASYGSVMGDLEGFIKGNEFFSRMLTVSDGHSVTEMFITMLMAILSIISVIPAVSVVFKLRSEEKRNRAEHILTKTVSRTKYMACYFVIATITGFIMLFTSVFGLWAASAAVVEDSISFGALFNAMMVYLPAVWIMTGAAVFVTGFLPGLTNLVWAFLGFSFFAVYMGRIMQFPDWVIKFSPFGHIPQLPVEEINFAVLIVMTGIAACLTALGFLFYSRRDIKPN